MQALNEAKGKILDDDSVITTLETLKQEAADISKKVEETDKVIAEIETVSQQYKPLSQVLYITALCRRNITYFMLVNSDNSKLKSLLSYVGNKLTLCLLLGCQRELNNYYANYLESVL